MSRVDGLASFNVGKGRGEGGSEKTYSADEVNGLIPYLSAHNSRGRDIYLTPLDPEFHYMVVDDMTASSFEDFRAAKYTPALVQESSADNLQAIVKVRKQDGPGETKAANQLVVDLNRRFGDPNFSGVIHPFRMAGFSNKKPGRDNAFTRVIRAAGMICVRARNHLEELRQALAGDRTPVPAASSRKRRVDPETLGAPTSDLEAAFDKAFKAAESLVAHKNWVRDESRLDYRAARELAAQGYDTAEIAAAILSRSPNLGDRHRDPLGYATRTAENAAISVADRPAPEGEHPEDDRPKGPGGM